MALFSVGVSAQGLYILGISNHAIPVILSFRNGDDAWRSVCAGAPEGQGRAVVITSVVMATELFSIARQGEIRLHHDLAR